MSENEEVRCVKCGLNEKYNPEGNLIPDDEGLMCNECYDKKYDLCPGYHISQLSEEYQLEQVGKLLVINKSIKEILKNWFD